MTPAEISILADAVEANTASVSQVALAFGWEPTNTYQGVIWTRGYEWSECPPMTASLDALAAECKRRGFGISLLGPIGPTQYWQVEVGEDYLPSCAATPAAALCAALLRAVAAKKEEPQDAE